MNEMLLLSYKLDWSSDLNCIEYWKKNQSNFHTVLVFVTWPLYAHTGRGIILIVDGRPKKKNWPLEGCCLLELGEQKFRINIGGDILGSRPCKDGF